MRTLRFISRIITGLLFIFSGTVKAIDPLGSAYKFGDYFRAFHLDFLHGLALPLAILLCTAEFLGGLSVLTGYRLKVGAWLVLVLMIIFTPLTLILALLNPVSDCGCFGDAVHLTNWQTFIKNIVILALVLVIFTGRNRIRNIRSAISEWSAMALTGLLFAGFALMNLRYLPLVDFLPYRIGTSIPEAMKVPEGKPADQYRTTFVYEKNGVRKEFTIDNYPAGDSSWVFVEQKSLLIKKGYQPAIHDFSLTSITGADSTEAVLGKPGYTLLLVARKLGEAGGNRLRDGLRSGQECIRNGIDFKVLTASGSDEIMKFGQSSLFFMADETTLKTMVRANPGYLLLKGGSISGKWSWASFPGEKKLLDAVSADKPVFPGPGRLPLYVATLLLILVILGLSADAALAGKKK